MTKKSIKAGRPFGAAVSHATLAISALASACFFSPSALAQQRGPTLTPNQEAIAAGVSEVCARLVLNPGANFRDYAAKLAAPLDDITAQCESFFFGQSSPENALKILDDLGAEEFNALRTVTAVFSQSQFQTITDRLRTRRSDAGAASAGINEHNRELAADNQRPLGGGAAADEGLFGDSLGLWLRGNGGSGEKVATISDGGFDADQWGATVGVDYRFGSALVAGASVGYGASAVDFNPAGGTIDIDSIAGSLYGGLYLGNFYLDVVGNYIASDYESQRLVQYLDGFGNPVNQNFRGATDGATASAGLAAGYNLAMGGFTLTPSVSYLYVDVSVDGFHESEGITDTVGYGMNLAFDDQEYRSSTGQATLDATYAWNQSWGVLIPHLRASYVEEFEEGVEIFGVRFANDPLVGTTNPSPPIAVTSDQIDQSYLRLSAGVSVQLRGSIAGYFEYQRLEEFENVEFQDLTLGVRMQF